MPANLVLDPKIRDWVLIPIVVAMFLQGVLREFVTRLMNSKPKAEIDSIRDAQLLRRSATLKQNANWLPPNAFKMRRCYFNDADKGAFSREVKAKNPADMLKDPAMGMDGMKKNMAYMVPQMVMMGWINYFFSGFVMVKVPFSLTLRFKAMLQRGLELQTLDVTYVSSLSWYFLNLFGLRGLYSIVLGENSDMDETKMMQQQMSMGMGGGPAAPDMGKVYKAEKENLDIVFHEQISPEIRLLKPKAYSLKQD